MTEQEERAKVVEVARSWQGTPYGHKGRTKGANGVVDCAQLVWAVFYEAGLTEFLPDDDYPPDWYMHRDVERYMAIVLKRAHPVPYPKVADIVLFRTGRTFSHGAIVMPPGYPEIIHAYKPANKVTLDRADGGRLSSTKKLFFSRW